MAAVSNEIAEAIVNVIGANWATYVPDEQKPNVFLTEEDISSAKCPAIGVYDAGDRTLNETMRGLNDDGTPKAGVVEQEFQFDLQVWVKGRRKADTLATMNEYRAGIKAILQDQYDLGGISATIRVDSSEPSLEMPEGSAVLRIGMVRASVHTWSLQGTTTLVGIT